MKHIMIFLLGSLIPAFFPVAGAESSSGEHFRAPWDRAYTSEQATGKSVIALWSFDGENPTADVSGHGHEGKLAGAKIDSEGRFGACLESACGHPVSDKRHAMLVKNSRDLTPAGAFTIEMWLNPGKEMKDCPGAVLLDKKYVAYDHQDYILSVEPVRGSEDLHQFKMQLGFGPRSVDWYSEPLRWVPGTWHHLAFTYDGAGTGEFFVDGRGRGRRTEAGVGSLMPGPKNLSVGDRLGNYYHGFPGKIDQVRISDGVVEFRSVRIEMVSDRHVFVRMEPKATVKIRLTNLMDSPLAEGILSFEFGGAAPHSIRIGELAPGASREVSFPLDTRMRPDRYEATLQYESGGARPVSAAEKVALAIVPRKLPGEFPVVMWGAGVNEIERLKEIGFTHAIGLRGNYQDIWKAGKPTAADRPDRLRLLRGKLDEALAAGVTFASQSSPGPFLRDDPKFQRVGRDGKPYKTTRPDICPFLPEVRAFVRNVGISMAQSYGDMPAYGAALLHTEVRGLARPCFHDLDRARFKKVTGLDIPPEVAGPRGVNWRKIKGFPENRVIPDDDPIYLYYRWYWKEGDGWNGLNTVLHKALKETMHRKDFWTWHDPAVRVASVFGSGGAVDVISQWTYSYPDPIRIGLATDELLTMASGADHKQEVMKMTQIIWYRSQTAPKPEPGKPGPEWKAMWEREQPDARFITIPPMHLREAFWTKIARPIKGIMYHGWQSLVPTNGKGGYRYTHPETRRELARLIREVVRPLGPALKEIPGIRSDVAFYECFASQVYAGRGTYGWGGGWGGDAWHVAVWAGLQPEIVYDESISSGGLDGRKVLFMPDCDVVTESALKAIRAFQQNGGLVVGDERLTPAIHPEIVMVPYKRTGAAAKDKAELLGRAAKLRADLAGRYEPRLASSNPEVVPYLRRFGATDYVFLVNDRREAGRYVGHHGLVLENGLPSESRITLRRSSGVAYDLVAHCPVKFRKESGQLLADFQLGPCEGRLIMVTPAAIDQVKLLVPKEGRRGGRLTARIEVCDAAGRPVDAVVPVEVSIEDPDGRWAEGSGYWAAVGGRLSLPIDLAPNDTEGIWQIRARELASGSNTTATFRLGKAPATPGDPAPAGENGGNAVQPNG